MHEKGKLRAGSFPRGRPLEKVQHVAASVLPGARAVPGHNTFPRGRYIGRVPDTRDMSGYGPATCFGRSTRPAGARSLFSWLYICRFASFRFGGLSCRSLLRVARVHRRAARDFHCVPCSIPPRWNALAPASLSCKDFLPAGHPQRESHGRKALSARGNPQGPERGMGR